MNKLSETQQGKLSAPTALLVEDHAIVRQGCRELLEQAGLNVIWEGADGGEAYRTYISIKPDLVVADLSIEGLSGLNLVSRIHRHHDNARIVVFSMHDDATVAARALNAGASGYVTKTSHPNELVQAVRAVLKGERYMSHDIAQALVLSELDIHDTPLSTLSEREFAIFQLYAEGLNSSEIASNLDLSTKSISNYLGKIKLKLGAKSVADLVRIAINNGVSRQNNILD